ncbi:hypothetical protein [Dysgonomonas sp. 25]|uniref:hypothetical protein n=1 Tax=Dysgonomonas sp. 25 TaxID=2302933 RepID=UPI0013D0373A|nr:hypothetical protein [Dysgonomonas sp. 25]NDV70410.1 hypothetical protein [Dysgonomonas sp. 25]
MKKYFLLAALLTTAMLGFNSCGSDNDDDNTVRPITEGTWEIKNRFFTTNYKDSADNFDARINPYFVAEMDTTKIEQFFEDREYEKYSEINTKRNSGTTLTKTYSWLIQSFESEAAGVPNDTLYLINPFTSETMMKGRMKLNKYTMTIEYKVDLGNATNILIDQYIDPNILNHYQYIEGKYTVQMQRKF